VGAGGFGLGDCVKIPGPVAIDPDFWRRRRVLVTGHTGFKGAWLSLWLQALGCELTGLAPSSPTEPSLYGLADVGSAMRECQVDVRDGDGVLRVLSEARPEIVFHLAAQPMVRRSLREPALTYEVNLMGTVNVLEAVRQAGEDVRAVVVVTSDKCYENPGVAHRFVESDPLGGSDPYSSSKACAELAAAAYRRSFFAGPKSPGIATARAGNVIGGGDWGEDRLLADAVRAVTSGSCLRVRNPDAVRPWQHVLNPLGGYLLLAQALWDSPRAARGWNFGPADADARTVGSVIERLGELWDGALRWELDRSEQPPEAAYLALDSSSAERELEWHPPLDLDTGLSLVVAWHEALARSEDMRRLSLSQIEEATAA
jgi:CDP-glucose 4,6-dehydratase